MKTADIRRVFLGFFAQRQHQVVPSSALIPDNDATLLFTNAGMVQFKDVFLGLEARPYQRATSSQKCLRAGGKHNDLENVGYTARHHTFFEMLGNFSFGDYSKRQAIQYAWEFLTQVLHLPAEKLHITVYLDDDEAADIWLKEIGIKPSAFSRCGAEENFWAMGDTGPCGPCSEIYFDHGPAFEGQVPGSGEPGDRYIEIWNLVFMQYNRSQDGELHALPKPSVDTGLGLERLTAVLQGVHNNYDIDLFQQLIKDAAALTHCQDLKHHSLKVIADHIRACSFMILDGIKPGPEGRGYVLRRIMRRAIRHGYQLGQKDTFFHQLTASLSRTMGEAYPELLQQQAKISAIILKEEQQFARTLDKGMHLLCHALTMCQTGPLPGESIFKLYDTYGFPVDLINDVAREHQVSLDMPGFEVAMAAQKTRARAASQFSVDLGVHLDAVGDTEFAGYEQSHCQARITGLFDGQGQAQSQLTAPEQGYVVLDKTPFYAEGGGQIGDRGALKGSDAYFEVTDTKRVKTNSFHMGKLSHGSLRIGDWLDAEVASDRRMATARNHSATHLLHAALRTLLGADISQKGSSVDALRLRFDFSYSTALSFSELQTLEHLVAEQILFNTPVTTELMNREQAVKEGALALFGEKYANEVRVLKMGVDNFSIELCGGTHVARTGDIGPFKIVSESSVSAGIRRIEALTGFAALEYMQNQEALMRQAAGILKAPTAELPARLAQVLEKNQALLQELKAKQAKPPSNAEQVKRYSSFSYVLHTIDSLDAKVLRSLSDELKHKYEPALVLVVGMSQAKIMLVAAVSHSVSLKLKAHDLITRLNPLLKGQGGGRDNFAQAGSNHPECLAPALAALPGWLEAL